MSKLEIRVAIPMHQGKAAPADTDVAYVAINEEGHVVAEYLHKDVIQWLSGYTAPVTPPGQQVVLLDGYAASVHNKGVADQINKSQKDAYTKLSKMKLFLSELKSKTEELL